MNLDHISAQLEKEIDHFLRYTDPAIPKALIESSDEAAFEKYLRQLELEHSVLLHEICRGYAQTKKISYDIHQHQWWLLRHRFSAALGLVHTFQQPPSNERSSILDPNCGNEDLISWLLVQYWEESAKNHWLTDQRLWFRQEFLK